MVTHMPLSYANLIQMTAIDTDDSQSFNSQKEFKISSRKKWDLLKLFQEWEGITENDGGVNSSMINLIYCKNFCKCHNVPPTQHNNKNKKFKNNNLQITYTYVCMYITQVVFYLPLFKIPSYCCTNVRIET
jgi:hypothetical protein